MASKEKDKKNEKNNIFPLAQSSKEPAVPTTSKDLGLITLVENKEPSKPRNRFFFNHVYNRKEKKILGRTCKSWMYIIGYSIMYLLFLSTFTMVLLYSTLSIIKMKGDYQVVEKTSLLTYSDHGVGLSATPTGVGSIPLIWYKDRDVNDYQKYINAIDQLLTDNRRKRHINVSDLGPCGRPPYGYGDRPCVIIRVNKQFGWSVKSIDVNSTNVQKLPVLLKNLLKTEHGKLILSCDGYHMYDKEHVGNISYFPDPPGIDASIFPLDMLGGSPLLAIQISDFTLGVSIAIECKLWYDGGTSSVHFLLYVTPKNSSL